MAGQASYVDSSVVLPLFLGDSGFAASETWLLNQGSRPLWISHWVLLEVAGVLALCIRRGDLSNQQARQWLLAGPGANEPACALRSADALHLAMAQRNGLELVTADGSLARAAKQLDLSCHWINATPPFNNP